MRTVIFGTGIFYLERKKMLPPEINIIAFLDNNKELHGKYLDGVMIYTPSDILKLKYDIIILASVSSVEMKKQLIFFGIPEEKIMFWEEYISSISHGQLIKYPAGQKTVEGNQKKVLLIVPTINYGGGFLAGLYAAVALKTKGYEVIITASVVYETVVSEVNSYGIDVWLCPSLPYIEELELGWIQQFDYVFVNSLQNIHCVKEIGKRRPLIWWLHENRDQYEEILGQYGKTLSYDDLERVGIFAVSNFAEKYFKEFYSKAKLKKLSFGVPDFYNDIDNSYKGKIIIGVIGSITPRKNQIELISVIKKLSNYEQNQIECWIIGKDGRKQYREQLNEIISDFPQVKICGEFSREEMERAFHRIDVVVCSSLEETMSMVIIEGMMNKKVCITNNNTGIAEFIHDGEDGFIYKAGNKDDLLSKLKYVIQNFKSLDSIRSNARKTYERYFTMDNFADSLQSIIENL